MCKHQMGKFDSCTDEYLFNSMGEDEVEVGDTYYTVFDRSQASIIPSSVEDIIAETLLPREKAECVFSTKEEYNSLAGVILECRSDGIVNSITYETKEDLENAWREVQRLEQMYLDDENEED